MSDAEDRARAAAHPVAMNWDKCRLPGGPIGGHTLLCDDITAALRAFGAAERAEAERRAIVAERDRDREHNVAQALAGSHVEQRLRAEAAERELAEAVGLLRIWAVFEGGTKFHTRNWLAAYDARHPVAAAPAVPRGHCNRCDRCGWEMVAEGGAGCWPSNCSMRLGDSVQRLPELRSTCAGCGAPYACVFRKAFSGDICPNPPAPGRKACAEHIAAAESVGVAAAPGTPADGLCLCGHAAGAHFGPLLRGRCCDQPTPDRGTWCECEAFTPTPRETPTTQTKGEP